MFIAKKIKTAIYTLLAVLLIAISASDGTAAAVGKEMSSATPWSWAHNVRAERLAKENVGMDTELLGQLLNELDESDFSINSGFVEGTVTLPVNDNGHQYFLAIEENSPRVTLNFGGCFWDIRSPRLFRFVRNAVAGIPVEEIGLELQSDVPPEIIDYATEYISERIKGYYEKWSEIEDPSAPCCITKAKISALTRVDTGTVGSDGGEELYRLEYRLKVSGNINAVLVDGMKAEGPWITEWDSAGQPYLLLHWENVGDGPLWEPICVTNTEEITSVYGTPEMLSQYDNAYTAAAVELYEAYKAGKNNETVVHVAYADEELLARSDELDQFMDYDSEYQVKLVFTTDRPLKDFKFLSLSFVAYDDEKGAQFDVEELHHVGELLPQRPLVIGMTFVGSMPDRGISFVDAEGTVKYYGIYQSGKDGSPQLSEFKK